MDSEQTLRQEIERVRGEHTKPTWKGPRDFLCTWCGRSYPCSAIRLADALEVLLDATAEAVATCDLPPHIDSGMQDAIEQAAQKVEE